MNGGKRYSNQKNQNTRNVGGGKTAMKEMPSSSQGIDLDIFINNMPIIKQSENARFLPKYTGILTRCDDDSVNMNDLDQLQFDLEKLISTCTLRSRYLATEFDINDERKDKKGKSYDKMPLKRKRLEEKSKNRDPKNGTKPMKRTYPLPVQNLIKDSPRLEISKLNQPNNDTSDKFWASVEPYCAPITNSHSVFLDKLIEECSQPVDIKIPDLGEYYANEWANNATNSEQEMALNTKTTNSEIKKNDLNAMIDPFSNPITQRLLAALIEEKVMTSFSCVSTGKLKPTDLNMIKPTNESRDAICMDRRLKKDLVEQGILTVEDLTKNQPEDEIFQEIRKCQQELTAVNEFNVEELKRLKSIVVKDLNRQTIKGALDKVDGQILELYNKILITKQKHIQQLQDSELDKAAFTQILKEFEDEADTLLKQQMKLEKDLIELSE